MTSQPIGFEACSCVHSWQVRADGQGREQDANGPDNVEHEIDADITEDFELLVGFAAMQEEAVKHAQERGVAAVKEELWHLQDGGAWQKGGSGTQPFLLGIR